MKKIMWGLFVFFLIIGSVNADYLYFDQNENQTYTISIRKYQSLNSAYINLTGVTPIDIDIDTYVDQNNNTGNFGNENYTYISRYVTRKRAYFGLNTTSINATGEYYLTLYKYSGGVSNPAASNLTIQAGYVNDTNQGVFNETGVTWLTQPCGSGSTSLNASCKEIDDPASSYMFSTLNPEWVQFNITECILNNISNYCTVVLYNLTATSSNDDIARFNSSEAGLVNRFMNNTYLDFTGDGDLEFQDSGYFVNTTRTADLATEINTYRSTCTAVNGNCSMPVIVHSDSIGVIELNNFSFDYNETIIDDCSEFSSPLITLHLYNETTKNIVNGTVETTVTLYYQDQLVTNASFDFTGDDNYTICTDSTLTYDVDLDAVYYDTGNYEVRSWFLENASISTASPEALYLYMVTDAESDGISIHLQDNAGEDYDDALIQVQRYYMDAGLYTTVAILRTDANGDAYTYLVPYDVWYKFIIVKDGVVTETIEALQIKEAELTFTVEADTLLELFQYWDQVGYSCSEDTTLNRFSCQFTDTSGLMEEICLRVDLIGAVTNTIECNTCAYTSSSTLTCTGINSTANKYHYTLYSETNDTVYVIDADYLETVVDDLTFGTDGLILSAFFIGVVAAIGLWNPAVGIIAALVGFSISFFMGFIVMEYATLVSIIIVGLILVFKVRT